METNCKMFVMAMLCFLVVAVASNTAFGVRSRGLMGEDKGDVKPNVPEKVASSPPPVSIPIQNTAPAAQGHAPQPQPNQSSPNSNDSSRSSKSSPLVDGSAELAPLPGPKDLNQGPSRQKEGNTFQNPPKKEEDKAHETSKKEGDKLVQSPSKEEHWTPHDTEKGGDIFSKDPTKDIVPNGSGATPKYGSPGDNKNKDESCEAANAPNIICHKGMLVACLLQSGIGSTEFSLLVQNTGPDDLNVNLKSPSKIKFDFNSLNVQKHSNKKVNLSAETSGGLIIVLSIGEEGSNCVLHAKSPAADWLSFQPFPAYYAMQVRPMHGAYILFAAVAVAGGTWACCKFRKKERQTDAGIPYQQLEMAERAQSDPNVAVVGDEVPTDAWDQSWDDDWDDEEAVIRTGGKARVIPSNGLSSRSGYPKNKDGWEIDWDD